MLLHKAIEQDDIERVKLLIVNGADVNLTNEHGKLPLHIAAKWASVELLGILIAAGANINAWCFNNSKVTALYEAVSHGHR